MARAAPVDKAVALVVRWVNAIPEVLVFRHPVAGVQIPKGTVESGEDVASATMRELHEESGVALDCRPPRFAQWDRLTTGGERHRWHLHLIPAPAGLPERWTHVASGSAEEDGLEFAFFWVPIDGDGVDQLDPLFAPAMTLLRAHLAANDRSSRLIPPD